MAQRASSLHRKAILLTGAFVEHNWYIFRAVLQSIVGNIILLPKCYEYHRLYSIHCMAWVKWVMRSTRNFSHLTDLLVTDLRCVQITKLCTDS